MFNWTSLIFFIVVVAFSRMYIDIAVLMIAPLVCISN